MNLLKLTSICIALWILAATAHAYPVGPALTLEKLQEKADFICKAVVVSTKPVEDAWFEKLPGFSPVSTDLKIIEVYKGANLTKASFRHYTIQKEAAFRYAPQYYEFEAGRAYLIFASKSDDATVFRQVTKHHTIQEDQGALRAADEALHPDKTVPQIYWIELMGLLKSKTPADVRYAILHLNRMSDGLRWGEPAEFKRDDVLKAIVPLLSNRDPEIAEHAIIALGTNNPLMDPGYAAGWLATIGKGHIPGYGSWDTKENLGGQQYWQELAAVAGTADANLRVRSLAIRALGRAKKSEIRPLALRWIEEKDPVIVQSAVILLSDYLEQSDDELLTTLASDTRDAVRTGVATAIGYGQVKSLIPLLGKMVNDPVLHVNSAATLSLLSFSLDDSSVTLKANLKHANYGPLFVNALAQRDPQDYVDELCDIVQNNRQPKHWWGGFVTWGDSWSVLFRAAQAATKADLNSKQFAKILTALEAPASGNPNAPTFYSSSEPRDLYALYVQKGLTARARSFREQSKKTITYDIDLYFKMVDENPGLYVRGK